MLLGFKPQFVPLILEGSKTHTIRAHRKNPPRVGEICHCYTGLRQKGAKLLGRWECVKVEEIRIDEDFSIRIDGIELDAIERVQFLYRDGFRAGGPSDIIQAAIDFWSGRLPFTGQVIHWKWTLRPADESARKPNSRRARRNKPEVRS